MCRSFADEGVAGPPSACGLSSARLDPTSRHSRSTGDSQPARSQYTRGRKAEVKVEDRRSRILRLSGPPHAKRPAAAGRLQFFCAENAANLHIASDRLNAHQVTRSQSAHEKRVSRGKSWIEVVKADR